MTRAAAMVDLAFMERALFLAQRGRPTVSPNPIVGAVVVSPDGVVVGQGAHLRAGTPHAEVHALEAAGARAVGATLYCTLEPCCHVGRTGPCVDRVVASGIRRVVAAIEDPNPAVAGKGFAYLRAHGIDVEVGVAAHDARRENAAFLTWVERRRPRVVLKAALSSDGFVGRAGVRVKLTSAMADRWFHRQRAEIDALAVGADTVIVDDPRLTPREVFRQRPLTRVIFDWRGRIPSSAAVFGTLDAGPIVVIVSREIGGQASSRFEGLRQRGIEIEAHPDHDLRSVLAGLADRGMLSLLVEGGPRLQTAFAEADLVDAVQRVTAPVVLGGGVAAPAIVRHTPGDGVFTRPLGPDTLVEFDVHGTD